MLHIEEIIVVEGRDDTAAIRRSVDGETIETHGFGIREETWVLLERAYEKRGLIVFTDPDTAGEQIRKRIMERFPGAKQAFLTRDEAAKAGDIGIENASPESIERALSMARSTSGNPGSTGSGGAGGREKNDGSLALGSTGSGRAGAREKTDGNPAAMDGEAGYGGDWEKRADAAGRAGEEEFAMEDLDRWGLNGAPGAREKRRALGRALGIGDAGAKSFLRRLNRFGISRQEVEEQLALIVESARS